MTEDDVDLATRKPNGLHHHHRPVPEPSAEVRSTTLQGLAIAAIVIGGLYFGRELFLPLALAILLSFVLTPPVILLGRIKVPRVLAVGVVVGAAFGIIAGLGWLISTETTKIAADLPKYRLTLSQKLESLRGSLSETNVLSRASEVLEDLGKELEQPLPNNTPDRVEVGDVADRPEQEPVLVEIREPELRGLALLSSIASTLLPPLVTAGIVLLFVVFILLQREDLRDRLIRLFGGSDLQRATTAMSDAASRLSVYFSRLVVINACYGAFIAVALWALGMPSAIAWGILAMLMRFVPYVGSYIAAAMPAFLAFAIDPGWSMLFMVLALFAVGELTMGQVVEPYVFGRGTGVTPSAVVGSTIFWTWLWGPIGLLIAMPVTVCLLVLGRHVEGLGFLEVLLGDQSPLTPEQSFYQRALVGDATEITYQAELALKDESLESHLGTVALGALKLAQRDALSGVLDAKQTERIGETIREMLMNLSDFEPRDWFSGLLNKNEADNRTDSNRPSSGEDAVMRVADSTALAEGWDVETPVLCISGRSVLDEAAAAIFAEAVRQRGLNAEVLSHEILTVGQITKLSNTDAKLICLSYLGFNSALVEIRYRVRRLRRILPKDTVILVLYLDETGGPDAAEVLEATGADAYAHTLQGAVELCANAALGDIEYTTRTRVKATTEGQHTVLPT